MTKESEPFIYYLSIIGVKLLYNIAYTAEFSTFFVRNKDGSSSPKDAQSQKSPKQTPQQPNNHPNTNINTPRHPTTHSHTTDHYPTLIPNTSYKLNQIITTHSTLLQTRINYPNTHSTANTHDYTP